MTISAALAPLVDLVYPPRCPLCGSATVSADGLCVECWSTLEMATGAGEDSIHAATIYNDTARRLVLALKHGRKIGLAAMLGRLMAARLPALEGEWLAMPVPLHRWRLWQRGFNQSALLARELARRRGLVPVVDGLIRRKPTPSLGGLGRVERRRVLAGAIAINPVRAQQLRGASVLLVDDVLTSGATTNACRYALHEGGARRVRIACFARVPGPD